ncbi:MAG TPA: hypothetical protein VLX92_05470 [Kofleriaceae bacterium]|nr:hypothetical protein [Kofleriaceae bacterium]
MTTQLASVEPVGLVHQSRSQTGLTYVRGALLNPVSMSVLAFVLCVGVGYAGLLGAVVAIAAFLTVGIGATRYRFVRKQLDRQYEYHARQHREAERTRQLRPTGPVRQQQYNDLRVLVEQIERTDPREAQRFELQALLDHFVRISASHQRCLDSLRLAGSNDLRTLPAEPSRSLRRREIMLRRQRHRDECVRTIERLSDELEAVDELIRLVAQRVACPVVEDDLDREIERRLWELDEVDQALHQLSA